MAARDPYQVLEVPRDASTDQIKKAYRKLARETHPDRTGGDDRRFKEVNAAHEVIGDPERRKLFDEFGAEAFKPGFNPDQARAFRGFGGGRGGFGGGGSVDIEDIMKMFMGGGGGGFGGFSRGPQRGRDTVVPLSVTLMEAIHGGERSLHLRGGGTVRVRIPLGVRTGARLRVAGRGGPGIDGGPAGDLLLEVSIADHPLVHIDRDDLIMDLPLTFAESLVGGRVEVPTPTGKVTVKLPPGAATGKRLRLRGKGMPKGKRDSRQGDLYLVLRPTPPARVDRKLKKIAEELAKAYDQDVRSELQFE